MCGLRIRPVSFGRFVSAEKSNFTYGIDQGVKIEAPIVGWLIEGGRKRILVDTGGSDPEWAAKYHHPVARSPEEEPVTALQRFGLSPLDIDLVVNTHLHWDHCFNNDLFANATIFVQEEELRYAIAPLPCHAVYYESWEIGMTPPWIKSIGRIKAIKGQREIEKGVTVIPLPGHTPGFQGVLVEAKSGRFLIAGDACPLFENWRGRFHQKYIPPGIHVNLFDCYQTFEKLEALGAKILPGHDKEVLETLCYE
jgi:glyoxylase-like metal-dependent hydrolase (beta-lactamase superfamily II)